MDARYSPPSDDDTGAAAVQTDTEYVEASQGQRLANFIIDSIAVRILGTIVTVLAADKAPNSVVVFAVFFGIWFGYYAGFEVAAGRTLGKFITRTRVVRTDGSAATTPQILGRTLARLAPFEALSFLTRGNWHDTWSGTRVIRAND